MKYKRQRKHRNRVTARLNERITLAQAIKAVKNAPPREKEMEVTKEFAERINPKKFNFSPKMVAVVGAIIGYDYGVRDRKGGQLTGLSITSDGFIICTATASDGGGAFVGDAAELDRNIAAYVPELSKEDRATFEAIYKSRVTDWRSYAGRKAN